MGQPKPIRIALESAVFKVHKGKLAILPSDMLKPALMPGPRQASANFQSVDLVNGFADLTISSPGTYFVLLSSLFVSKMKEERHYQIPTFSAGPINVTKSDLEAGKASITLSAQVIVRVLVSDEQRPLPRKSICFQVLPNQSFEVKTDEAGIVYLLASAGDLFLYFPEGGESLRISIPTVTPNDLDIVLKKR